MEAIRNRFIQQNEERRLNGDFAIASSPSRSSVRPLPRRNATPAQTPSRKDPLPTPRRPASPAVEPHSLSAPADPSSAAPHIHAPSPARAGETLSTPRMTCKDWDFHAMLDTYRNFRPVRRVSALAPPDELLRELSAYEKSGEPLIIENWHKHPKWQEDLLGMEWLLAHVGDKEIPVRNVHNRKDTLMTLSQFVERSRCQEVHAVPGESERYYWKDGECPDQWKVWLSEVLPTTILPGSRDDLLRHLFPSEAVETLLCYLGIGDTYTPAHKDLCASSGHNLMCFAENDGSSFWFMTKSNAAPKVAEYFQKELGQELDWETHVTTLQEWGNAKFDVHVAEQKVGDLVLVPPRSVHQVVNRGGLAMKTSWSRMTLNNLQTALLSELPIYRRVCRLEQYRVKTVLYRSILHYTEELLSTLNGEVSAPDASRILSHVGLVDYGSPLDSRDEEGGPPPNLPPQTKEQLARTLWRLIRLFDDVLYSEFAPCHDYYEHITRSQTHLSLTANNIPPSPAAEQDGSVRRGSFNLACDFCGADIFQSFFECQRCRAEDGGDMQIGDGLLICPACYVEGRTCSCDKMEPRQCRPFDVLLQDRNKATDALARVPFCQKNGQPMSPLSESHFSDHRKIRIFAAACTLHELKDKHSVDKLHSTRRCRVGTSGQESKEGHDAKFISGLGCSKCHAAKCYVHLVRAGTHCAEALLASRVNDVFYHDLHRTNGMLAKQRPPALYDVKGADVKDRLVVAAISFPRCKPGHSKLQLGWYDQEPEVAEPVDVVEKSHPEDTTYQSMFREDSPLTPVSSPAKESDSPSFPVVQRPTTTHSKRTTSADDDDDSVISINSDSDDHRDDPVSVARPSPPVKHKRNRAYVELPSVASLRRTSSPASVDLEPRRKKARLNKGGEGSGRSAASSRLVGPRASIADDSDSKTTQEHVGGSYGPQLATLLAEANATPPIFTQPILSARPRARQKGGVRRVISPDPEGSPSPPVNIKPSESHSRPSTEVPAAHKSSANSRDVGSSMLHTSQSAGRMEQPSSAASEQAPDRELPRKRKRTGPPGIPDSDFPAHMKRLQQVQRVAGEPRKKARLRKMEVDKEDDKEKQIDVDDAQEVSVLLGPTQGETSEVTSPTATQPVPAPALPQASLSSISSITVSVQSVSPSQELIRQSPTSLHDPRAPSEDIHPPSAPGPSQLTPPTHQHPPISDPARPSRETLISAISAPLRALADSIDSNPNLLQPGPSPELERAMQHMQVGIRDLRVEMQAAQSRFERQIKDLEDDRAKLHEQLQNERRERGFQANIIRGLQEKVTQLEKQRPSLEGLEKSVKDAIMELMPTVRARFHEMASQAVVDTVTNSVLVQEQRLTMTLRADGASAHPVNMGFPQIEPAVQIPQGPAGFSDRPFHHHRQYGAGGPQRNYPLHPQGEYQRGREGRDDNRSWSNTRYQPPGPHGGNRDDGRQFHPRPPSSGSPGGSENGRPPTNFNNFVRRPSGRDNDRSRRDGSPRRARSRSTDRRKDQGPVFDDNTDSESVPRLRTAAWPDQVPPTSSIGQFDDGDEMRAVGGSSTDPELSPIESFPSSSKSRANSEIQESSFTERDAHNETPKKPDEPRELGHSSSSPVRGRHQLRSRPIRQ